MLLVLVLGVGASFAADTNQTEIQASDDTDTVVSISETDTVSSNDNDTVISVNENSGETLGATTGTFTELDSLISSNYGKTLTLTQDYAYNSDYGKTTGIVISDAITIDGQGIYTLDGGSLSRIFQITGANVVIKNINFKNGYYSGTNNGGGAILWSGSYGKLTKCNFTNCTTKAGSTSTGGGAVYWSGTRGNLTYSIFKNNRIISGSNPRGGAIQIAGTYMYIGRCNFTFNTANVGDGDGGCLYIRAAESLTEYCYFAHSQCIDLAGGLFIEASGNSRAQYNQFYNCSSIGRGQSNDGSAMCISGGANGVTTVYKCNFTNCWSYNRNGAALNLYPSGSNGKFVIDYCNFINNTNTYNGGIGGGCNSQSGYTIITNCKFINNTATYGGGLYIVVANNNVSNCYFEGNGATAGGGLYLASTGCLVHNCTFKENEATSSNGGGLYVSGTSTTIEESVFTGNTANNGEGGGFYVTPNNSAVIQGNTYQDNHALTNNDYSAENVTILIVKLYISPNGNGAGSEDSPTNWTYAYENIAANGEIIFVDGDYTNFGTANIVKTLTITGQENAIIYGIRGSRIMSISAANAVIRNLTFKDVYFAGNGAAIVWSGSYGLLQDCTFENCESYSTSNNGAVYWSGISGTVDNCTFINNKATGTSNPDAGAICWTATDGVIKNSYFKNNTGLNDGGAIIVSGSEINNLEIHTCNFVENKAQTTNGHGGAINVWNGDNVKIYNCNFTKNTAESGLGGAVYWGTGSPSGNLYDCNFDQNTAVNGGAVYWNGATGSLSSSNFTSNVATEKGGAVYWNTNDGSITSSNFNSNRAVNGSAIYLSPSVTEFELKEDKFTSNVASGYGTVAAEQLTDLSIGGNTFTSNTVSSGANDYYFYEHTPENITSALVYVSPSGSASSLGMTSDSPTTFDHALEIIEEGGKIVLLNGEYSDIVEKTISQSIAIVGSENTVLLGGNKKFFTITANGVIIENIAFKNGKVTGDGGAITWNGDNGQIIGSTFTNNVATANGGALYWTGTGGKIDSTTFESNTAANGNNLYSTNTVTVTNSVLKDQFTLTKTGNINYGTDEVIGGTFASNAPSSITLYLGTTSKGSISVSSNTFSKTLSLLPVGTYAISFKDANSNTYAFTDNSFTVNRLSIVYISPSGTGSGNSASSPTTWDKVADIISPTGTVVFGTGDYSNFYGKTISQGWTLQAASGATPVLDANSKGRIFTISANNVKINGLTFKNGEATDSYGSAIHWTGTGGTLTNSVLTANTGRPVTATTTLTMTNNQLKDQITLTKSNINWAGTETITGTFAHNAPSTVNILFNGTSQGSYSVASGKVTASYAFTNPSTRSVGSYVVTDQKNIYKEVL